VLDRLGGGQARMVRHDALNQVPVGRPQLGQSCSRFLTAATTA
jgi:hypothetical protein